MLKVKPKRGINVNHRTPNWEIIHILRNCNRYWNWKPLKWTISASKLLWTQSQQIFQHHLYLTELSKPKESCEASRTKTMWSDGPEQWSGYHNITRHQDGAPQWLEASIFLSGKHFHPLSNLAHLSWFLPLPQDTSAILSQIWRTRKTKSELFMQNEIGNSSRLLGAKQESHLSSSSAWSIGKMALRAAYFSSFNAL